MQTLTSYLIESAALAPPKAEARVQAVIQAISSWLQRKGVKNPSDQSGTFKSLTDHSEGTFTRKQLSNEKGTLEEIRLEELSRGGQTFTTTIYIVALPTQVSVHATLSVKNATSVIAPISTDPRCPSVIRTILELYPDWFFNGTAIGQAKPALICGNDEASLLVEDLRSEQRSLPIVVVSQNEGEPIWPTLANELAYDLSGLANVVTIDEAASWVLTDELGKLHSCYRGAVRLYWPTRKLPSGTVQVPSTVWTASSLLSNDHDGKGLARFRATIRRAVMAVAALTIEAPNSIREVQNFSARKQLEELEARADANSDELQFARLFIKENEDLKLELSQARSDIAKLSSRAEVAEYALSVKSQDTPVEATENIEHDLSPTPGEIRFYKKTHSTPSHDVLVRVNDCGHTKWQGSAKADKARKGLEKLEGATNWKTMLHCANCTGGGTWKVRW